MSLLLSGLLQGKVPMTVAQRGLKVCILGALGGVGQPLSLLVKTSPWFEEAALYDIKDCKGLELELNQIDTPCKVTAYSELNKALRGSHIVLNLAGMDQGKVSDDDLFKQNAQACVETCRASAKVCPDALTVICSKPVNSLVPVALEAFKRESGCTDPGRLLGLTLVDCMRAASAYAELTRSPPEKVRVPVVGGQGGARAVPLFSKADPCANLSTDETVRLARAVQGPDTAGPAPSLGPAAAALRLAESLARGLLGHHGVVECAYVFSSLVPGLEFFASPVQLGQTGLQKIPSLPSPLTNFEACLLETSLEYIKADIEKAKKFVFT